MIQPLFFKLAGTDANMAANERLTIVDDVVYKHFALREAIERNGLANNTY
jgi:hypothetical protein